MQEFETTLTEKGQVTIPIEIRRIIGLQPKDKVSFEVDGDTVKIKRATSKLLAGFGAVQTRPKLENDTKIREEFEKGVAEEVVSEV